MNAMPKSMSDVAKLPMIRNLTELATEPILPEYDTRAYEAMLSISKKTKRLKISPVIDAPASPKNRSRKRA